MPVRPIPLVTGEVYHVFNRGNASVPIFQNKWDYHNFIGAFIYYQYSKTPMRYSLFRQLSPQKRNVILKRLEKENKRLVEIISYCLMPNHFHFLLKQKSDSGVKDFIRLITNSHSRYYNIKYHRKGSLFENRFKAVRIETDQQLLHVSRYIHLNPYTSFLIKKMDSLAEYPFSSFKEYIQESFSSPICNKLIILGHFKKLDNYKKFVFDQADYQRNLGILKHLILED